MTAIGTRGSPPNEIENGSHVIDFSNINRPHLPTYELPAYDQPPPSYEDAIKGDAIVATSAGALAVVPKTQHLHSA